MNDAHGLEARGLFLVASPHISSHTRDLIVAIPQGEHEQRSLGSILRSLPNVVRLAVHGRALHWPAVDDGLKHALHDVIAPPSVRVLHLFQLHDVSAAFLAHAMSPVSSLMSRWVHVGTNEEIAVNGLNLATDPLLRELIIGEVAQDVVPFCDVLLRTPAYLANLERLGIAIHAIRGPYDGRLLIAVTATLQHLEDLNPLGTHSLIM